MKNHIITSYYILFPSSDKDSQYPSVSNNEQEIFPFQQPELDKRLETLSREEQIQNYPTYTDRLNDIRNNLEEAKYGLSKCIIDYIRSNGGKAEYIAATGIFFDNGIRSSTYRRGDSNSIQEIVKNNLNGKASIAANINGTPIRIEINIGDKERSFEHIYCQMIIESAELIYYIAKDFPSFVDWYHTTFNFIPNKIKSISTCFTKELCGMTLGAFIIPILKRANSINQPEGEQKL